MLNKTENQLLHYLLERGTWTASKELIAYLGCSTRSLRSFVAGLNTAQPLILSSRQGYRTNPEFEDYLQALTVSQTVEQENLDYPADRQKRIIKKFLLSGNQLDFYELAESLYVSESTLSADLTALKSVLENYDLTLSRRKNQIILKGLEQNIRLLFSETIYEEIKDGILNFNILSSLFPDYDVEKLKQLLIQIISEHDLQMNDFGVTDLILHLCILLDRIRSHQLIQTESPASSAMADAPFLSIARELFQQLEKELQLTVPAAEIQSFAPLIAINTKELVQQHITIANLNNYIPEEINQFVREITEKVYTQYLIDLRQNDFIIRFSLHLAQILKTQRRHNKNPLYSTIKDSYPLVYEISVYIAELIVQRFHIPLNKHEISFIALHAGITMTKEHSTTVDAVLIIPEYHNLRDFVYSRLHESFRGKLNLVAFYSSESEINYHLKFDLILSTQALSVSAGVDYVQISPFFNSSDLLKIEHVLNRINRQRRKQKNESLLALFDKRAFQILDSSETDPQSILRQLSEQLVSLGAVSTDFYDHVLYREAMSSTSYSNLAVPHSLELDSVFSRIAVCLVKEKLRWGENQVNLILLLAVNEENKRNFKTLFQSLLTIFTSRQWGEQIQSVNSFEDFQEFIEHFPFPE